VYLPIILTHFPVRADITVFEEANFE
jgi:hypothetical protein